MPELPEVETIRRDLGKRIVGQKIIKAEVLDKKLGDRKKIAAFLAGKKIISAERAGKLLSFGLQGGNYLLVHLKMTGQLVYCDGKILVAGGHESNLKLKLQSLSSTKIGDEKIEYQRAKPENFSSKYARFLIDFSGGRKLFFNDLRRFGYVKIVSAAEWEIIKSAYGIEPLKKEFTLKNLKKALSGKKNIKAALLDQKNIAGIGNIYADEILFASRIRPDRRANSLSSREIKKIHQVAGKIIAKAIKYRGTTFSDYIDARGRKGNFSRFLKVYSRAGEKCLVCGKKIEKIKIAGRGTHFCSKCQK
jgi:formamidopyrimidine-DNA glycosylase